MNKEDYYGLQNLNKHNKKTKNKANYPCKLPKCS